MASIIKVDTIQDQDGNNIINENAGTITIGKSGDTVQVAAGATLEGAGLSWQSTIKTASFTAVAGEGYWINTTSAAVTMTLPASASVGDTIEIVDYARTWGTNAVTINTNSLNYQGNTSPNPQYNTDGQHVRIVYSGATQGWIPTVDDDVTFETPQAYSIDFLVVAGGAGGGSNNAGGGGGGGMRTSTQTANGGVTITCTVGGGGAGTTGGPAATDPGGNGSDSSISGTGLTTITSAGGGGGGKNNDPGQDGGTGGGRSYNGPAGAGSGNIPATTPSQGADGGEGYNGAPSYAGGGGGGGGASGQTGVNATSSTAGNGGNGTQSSITGIATYYAGGGGGSGDAPGIAGTGGLGGGGPGSHLPRTDEYCDGTDGLGGGGGAHYVPPSRAGNGGSGVVILSVPTANYSGTTTGSPTVTTSGSNTIIKFTGTGSYTT